MCAEAAGAQADAAQTPPAQDVVRPVSDPIKPRGGYSILYGDLAPEGCIVKLAGHGREKHTGPARVFDSEEAAFAAVQARKIEAGDVIVTGTPGGVGARRTPPVWMKPGDVVEIEVDRVGVLRNTIADDTGDAR